jgi:hypothetical protein
MKDEEVAPAKLAVDGKVEERQIPDLPGEL